MHTVLIIDDAEDILELAQIGFEMSGWTCHTADSGNAALSQLEKSLPDLILLDYDLPGETGLDILGRIQAKTTAVPVVFLTGQSRPEEIQKLLAAGAVGVLNKPFDPMSIADKASPFLK